jgi:hypothetical protein
MKEGFEITEEIKKIATGYNFYSCYINNYGQMKEAEEKNSKIMNKLKLLGVEKIKQD